MNMYAGGPGCYGKLPGIGDFFSRRLDPGFAAAWDRWLQAGLLESRSMLGAQWSECYLSAPIWRFAMAPGVCGDRAVLGILMPSVDSVGRYFPFSIVQEVGKNWSAVWALAESGGWFDRVERIALAGLNDNLNPGQIDELLGDCLIPSVSCLSAQNAFHVIASAEKSAGDSVSRNAGSVLEYLLLSGAAVVERSLERQAVWWQSHRIGGRAVRRSGLLSSDLFATLLKRDAGVVSNA